MPIKTATRYSCFPSVSILLVASLLLTSLALGQTTSLPAHASGTASAAAVPAYRQAEHVAILSVRGEIDRVTLMSLERRMKQVVAQGADAVVIEINTPGGDMYVTLDICNLLKSRSETPANVVAWVHPTAYSAGTIMALACREIIVSPGSTIGDAAPIAFSPLTGLQSLPPTERAKILSPLLKELIDSARRNHYDENLVQAFVMVGLELWMIENIKTGERAFVDRAEYNSLFGEEPPQQFGSPLPPQPAGAAPPPAPLPRHTQNIPHAPEATAADPDQLQKESLREKTLPPVRSALTPDQRNDWQLLLQVTDGSTLLTLKSDEAVYYGLAQAVIANDTELQSYFGARTVTRLDANWSEGLVRFLISVPVRGVLIAIFLVCLFIELGAPGFGVFGTTAVIALLVLIGAPALVGMAQWWHILLIGLGLLLVAAELFVIPGFGVPGIVGAMCVLVGLVGTFVSGDVTTTSGQNELWTGLLVTLLSVFASGIIIWLISRQLHSIPILNKIILTTELRDEPSLAAGGGGGMLEAMGPSSRQLAAGDLGVAETDLRPSGRANFGGRLIDVKSVSTFIDKGTPIRVVSVGRFVVEVEENEP